MSYFPLTLKVPIMHLCHSSFAPSVTSSWYYLSHFTTQFWPNLQEGHFLLKTPRLRRLVFRSISVLHACKYHLLMWLSPVQGAESLNTNVRYLYAPTLSLVFAMINSSTVEEVPLFTLTFQERMLQFVSEWDGECRQSLRKGFKDNSCVVQIYSWPDSTKYREMVEGFFFFFLKLQLSSPALQMMLVSSRKDSVPRYHLLFHGKAPYDEVLFARHRDLVTITKHSAETLSTSERITVHASKTQTR